MTSAPRPCRRVLSAKSYYTSFFLDYGLTPRHTPGTETRCHHFLLIAELKATIAEQPGTSIAMIQEHYGKYIRDDGDALLRAYVEKPKLTAIEQKTGTFAETFSRQSANYRNSLASPTGFEPVHT